MKNILFYGASVTHQSGDNGYYENLISNDFIFNRLSYPSSQFFNAGFFNIVKIKNLLEKPDFVFFEWSTTGENEFDLLKLEYFIQELLRDEIGLVFLILPKKETYQIERICDKQLYKLSSNFSIPILDLRGILSSQNPDEILRDGVHTTKKGAKLYSESILDFLESKLPGNFNNTILAGAIDFNIKIYDVNRIISESQSLILNFSSVSKYGEIALSHTIGPFSPVIEYLSNDAIIGTKSIFDPWCYYERDNFTTLVSQSMLKKLTTNSITIKISADPPDFGITKTGQVFNLQKKLDIKSIFTCGLNDLTYCVN